MRPSNALPREHSRLPSSIPVTVEMVHVWEGSQTGTIQGAIFTVSRGGAGGRVGWVLPPRTWLRILVPAAPSSLRLVAEVVWTSLVPGVVARGAVYGIRWAEQLSRKSLEAILPSDPAPTPDA